MPAVRVPPPLPRREAATVADLPSDAQNDIEPNTPRISVIREIIEPPMPVQTGWTSRGRALVSIAVALAIVGAVAAIAAIESRRTKSARLNGLLPALPLLPASVIQTSLRGAPFVVVPMGPASETAGRPNELASGRRALPGQTRRAPLVANAASPAAPSGAASSADRNVATGRYEPDVP